MIDSHGRRSHATGWSWGGWLRAVRADKLMCWGDGAKGRRDELLRSSSSLVLQVRSLDECVCRTSRVRRWARRRQVGRVLRATPHRPRLLDAFQALCAN